jgi:lipopolysaccharide transport system ATP-binding protein
MSETVIRVENLSKKYILSHQQEGRSKYKSLRESINNGVQSLSKKLLKPSVQDRYNPAREEFWALNDVSFEIKQGDKVGIIGRNGAGKSTLLKIISRITEPTKGRIKIKGRVASLLEVGTGFHPELTGRENIFLNGAILGMTKAEIQHKFDEIVTFAEVEKFLDTPVKRYSSGMYVRLAFAVAAHLEPEIFIVDEVLAVGDTQFQKKCLGKMGEVAKDGRTVIFVSHNMAALYALCSTAFVLNKGQVICSGSTSDCIAAYENQNDQEQGSNWIRPSNQQKGSLAITELNSVLKGEQPELFLELEILLESNLKHNPAFLAVEICAKNGTVLMQSIPQIEGFITNSKEKHFVNVSIDLPPLIPGQYLINVWVGSHNTETLDQINEVVKFDIHESPTRGRSFPHDIQHGYIVPKSTINILK